ncbi:MAG: transglutaminase domain-containing protein [Kofleriaceae bacterium]|nr:transglutaminase domain-containing protein [Kofleriaceae bacterium]
MRRRPFVVAVAALAAALAGAIACSPRPPAALAPAGDHAPDPGVTPPPRVAWALTWRGAAIGGAWEHDDGARLTRRERVVVRRGDEVVVSELTLAIERDAAGRARAIDVARWQDGPMLAGTARRDAGGGWRIEVEGEPAVTVPDAAPFELVLREVGPTGTFRGPVLLAGWGFAVAELDLAPDPGAAGGQLARLYVAGRWLEARVRRDADGAIAEIVGGDGVVARRAALDAALRPPAPAEVVDVQRHRRRARARARRPRRHGDPGAARRHRARAAGGARSARRRDRALARHPRRPRPWRAGAGAASPDRTADIAALARVVAADVVDHLGVTATTLAAARAATHGDCTTHALRFAALAAEHGIPVRVVTGLRRDGDALVRHRWNLAWTGARWLAVDPTWGEAPAAPVLVGLAVHGARAADLAAADATAFEGLGGRARLE